MMSLNQAKNNSGPFSNPPTAEEWLQWKREEKRDAFAAAALTGLLAGNSSLSFVAAAFQAIHHAEALLNELYPK